METSKALKMLETYGIPLRSIAREVGISYSILTNAKGEHQHLAEWHHDPVLTAIRRRGLILENSGASPSEMLNALREAQLTLPAVASKVGISKQAVHQFLTGKHNTPDARAKEIHATLKDTGRKLMQLGSRNLW